MNTSTEVVDLEIYGEGNLTIIVNNFKHGHYISFVRTVLNKQVTMIEDSEIKKRFFPKEKEPLEVADDETLLFQLEDNSVIKVEPLRLESKIRFEFTAEGETQEESDRKLLALRETVLSNIEY